MRGAKADSFFWQLLRMRESPCRRLYRMPAMLQEAQRRPTRKPRGREVADSLEGILGSIWKRCQTGVVAAIAVLCASHSPAQETVQTVAQLVKQIDAQIAEMEKDTGPIQRPQRQKNFPRSSVSSSIVLL